MDLRFGEKYEALGREVEAFARAHWPPRGEEASRPETEQRLRFRRKLLEAGYLARTVPLAYGGQGLALDVLAETVIRQALQRAEAPWRPVNPQGTDMLVPTLLEEGTEAQKQRYIPPTLAGELIWCQGYSEPGSGSDLASLQSRAVLDGDHWVLNGQKIWTSNADEADMMFGLFRTEPDQRRSRGITYLLVDMKSPGITVRPLTMMNGGLDFCEVFFDDVRVPRENVVGQPGGGWKVSKATLKHERMLIGDASYLEMNFENLLELARRTTADGRPAIDDPVVRRRLAEIEGFVATQRYASYRMVSAIARNEDLEVMNDMIMTKLYLTNAVQKVAKLAMDLLGTHGLTASSPEEASLLMGWHTPGRWVGHYMTSLGLAIAGGTSNIQRNIIGERLLGLPRDLRREAG